MHVDPAQGRLVFETDRVGDMTIHSNVTHTLGEEEEEEEEGGGGRGERGEGGGGGKLTPLLGNLPDFLVPLSLKDIY